MIKLMKGVVHLISMLYTYLQNGIQDNKNQRRKLEILEVKGEWGNGLKITLEVERRNGLKMTLEVERRNGLIIG